MTVRIVALNRSLGTGYWYACRSEAVRALKHLEHQSFDSRESAVSSVRRTGEELKKIGLANLAKHHLEDEYCDDENVKHFWKVVLYEELNNFDLVKNVRYVTDGRAND